jgi:hypothetical protein
MKRKKKILILASNPAKSSRLRLDKEVREIEEGLRLAKYRDRFEIHKRFTVRTRDIGRALLDIEPDIVHYCGHGSAKGLMVEDESGKAVWLQTEALAGLFQFFSNRVECVLLNACHSHVQATAINLHIDFVIGMSSAIRDSTAIQFAVGFYDALGAGRSYEQAFKFGKNAILMDNKIPEFTKPAFYSRQYTAASPQPVNQRVTLCYAYEDKTAFAQPLARRLQHYAEDIKINELVMSPQDLLVDKISSHTRDNEYVVVLLTPGSIGSGWVKDELVRELSDFQEEDELRIIPAIFGDCAIPGDVKEFFYVDFRKFFGFGLKELLRTFSIRSQLLSEAETKKLLLNMLSPIDREQVKKYVLVPDNSREKAVKEIKQKKLKYLVLGVLLWLYYLTWHPLVLIPVFGDMAALIACFGVFLLGAFSVAKYTHPKLAVGRYFKLLSRFDELVMEQGQDNQSKNSGTLYYELQGKAGKKRHKKYRIDKDDIDESLDKCRNRYLIYAGLIVGVLIFLTISGIILPKELKKTLSSLQGIVVVWGFFVYILYDEKVKEIRQIYNLKRDFERLANVFASKDD